MPLTSKMVVVLFNVWGIDFMAPSPSSYGYDYILVAIDYVPKWIEAIVTKTNDSKIVMGRVTFATSLLMHLLRKYNITHKVATPYHPQTLGQVELSYRQIKTILERTVETTRKGLGIAIE